MKKLTIRSRITLALVAFALALAALVGAVDAYDSEDRPEAPHGLYVEVISAHRIDISWTDNSDDEEGFSLYRSGGGSGGEIARLDADETSYTDNNLRPNTKYTYQVRAYNHNGTSEFSNYDEGVTFQTVPRAPSGLRADASSPTTVNLNWDDNSSNEDGFQIFRSTAGGSFMQIGSADQNATSYTDNNVRPNTTYYYQIRSYNQAGTSEFSGTDDASTPGR